MKNILAILLLLLLPACQNMPLEDEAQISTYLADTVVVGISQTAALFTATNTDTPEPSVTPTIESTRTAISSVTAAPTATSAAVYYSYIGHTSTPSLTPTLTSTGSTFTPSPTITGTSASLSWMCQNAERSASQGDGCTSFCSLYASSLESQGLSCYAYGQRIYAPEATSTTAPTATSQPTEAPTNVPTVVPTEIPTAVPTAIPTDKPTEETSGNSENNS